MNDKEKENRQLTVYPLHACLFFIILAALYFWFGKLLLARLS